MFSVYELGLYPETLHPDEFVTGRFIPAAQGGNVDRRTAQGGRNVRPYFERTMPSVLLVVSPIYIGLSLTAATAILVVFGPKWTGMAPIVVGHRLVMRPMAVQIICSPTCTATGKERIYLATGHAGAVIFATSFFIGVRFGAEGLVHAWWIAAPLLLAFTLALASRRSSFR